MEEDKAINVHASTSIRRVAEAGDMPRSTVQNIIRRILQHYSYKFPLVRQLIPHDFESRHLFSLQFHDGLEVDLEWPWNVLWTDEEHFHLDSSVNTHNFRIWQPENPR